MAPHTRIVTTRFGAVRVVTAPDGIRSLRLHSTDVPPLVGDDAAAVRCSAKGDLCAHAEKQVLAYSAGTRRSFSLPLDWSGIQGFTRHALVAITEIPYGEVASYGEVAELAGSPRAARAVGAACKHTPFSLVVPVHRVIRGDGTIGGFGDDIALKRALLDHEQATLRRRPRS